MLNPTTNAPSQGAHGPQEGERTSSRRVFRPNVDICETKDAIELIADMPGVDEKAAEVTLERDVLTIRGKVDWQTPEAYRALGREFEIGDYERVFTLATEVEQGQIQASVKHGVLRVVLPKAAPPKARRIEVKTG